MCPTCISVLYFLKMVVSSVRIDRRSALVVAWLSSAAAISVPAKFRFYREDEKGAKFKLTAAAAAVRHQQEGKCKRGRQRHSDRRSFREGTVLLIESLYLLRLVAKSGESAIEGETKARVKHCAKSESGTRAYLILRPRLAGVPADDVGESWSRTVDEKGNELFYQRRAKRANLRYRGGQMTVSIVGLLPAGLINQ